MASWRPIEMSPPMLADPFFTKSPNGPSLASKLRLVPDAVAWASIEVPPAPVRMKNDLSPPTVLEVSADSSLTSVCASLLTKVIV